MPRAPRRCPGDHYECPNLIRGGQRYCPDHDTAWRGRRTASSAVTSTTQWRRLRAFVLKRDNHQCRIQYPEVCVGRATVVDHIISTAAGGAPLDPDNAQAACSPCNARKAQRESAAAQRRPQRRR